MGAKGNAEIARAFHQAQHDSMRGHYDKAAIRYAALTPFMAENTNLPLRAARSYRKAGNDKDAARWFLEAAECYAVNHRLTEAVSTLRLYHEVAPNEHVGPKRIFNLCRERGKVGSRIFEFLSLKDQAVYKLRAEDVFAAFDENTFDQALDAMVLRQLKNGEVLIHANEAPGSIYFVVHGRLEEFLVKGGKRTHLAFRVSGEICGAIAYFSRKKWATGFVAREAVDVLELPYSVLDKIKAASPEFCDQFEALYRFRLLSMQLVLAPVFRKLDADTRRHIATQMIQRRIKAGEFLFREDDESCDVYLLRSGRMAIDLNINGRDRQLKTVGSSAVLGEIDVAVRGRRTATARAESDCELMQLPGEAYQQLYRDHRALRGLLEARKRTLLRETRRFIRQLNIVDGDKTCQLLLKDIMD